MKIVIILIILVACLKVSAQPDTSGCVKEINETVWKPFIKYLEAGNNKGFSSLHSKRILRVVIDNNQVQDYERYFPVKTRNDTISARGPGKLLFELRFDKRICDGTRAWHSGYYQGRIMEGGKQKRTYYGRFYVVLEKEAGTWKIIVDADTGKDANEETFKKATAIE